MEKKNFSREIRELFNNNQLSKLAAVINSQISSSVVSRHDCLLALNICKCANVWQEVRCFSSRKPLSIVTVNLNNKKGLASTVESVLKQTARGQIQYIVIDGYSDDGSLDYLHDKASDIDIAIYGKDVGVYDAMNLGISLSESDYTLFLNSGDTLVDDTIVSKFLDNVDEGTKHDVLYGDCIFVSPNVTSAGDIENLWKGMVCSHQSVFFKTSQIKNNKYNQAYRIVSDYDLLYRLYTGGSSFRQLPWAVSQIEPVGISSDFYERTLERWQVVRKYQHPRIDRQEIDDFYRSLLATQGKWVNPQTFNTNKHLNSILSNVENRLIFLISMPRSGSTLLQKILENTRMIGTASEPWVMLPLLAGTDHNLTKTRYCTELASEAISIFQKDIGSPNAVQHAQKVYADAVYSAAMKQTQKKYFLDKTPRYIYIAEKIQELYPNAKFIVLLRNPAAVITSYAQTWRRGDFDSVFNDEYYRYDFTEGFKSLARYLNNGSKKHVVKYEDLVAEPQSQVRGICQYLGIPYSDDYIEYSKASSTRKFAFGDPESVYKNTKPVNNPFKWLDGIKTVKNRRALTKCLDLIPPDVIAELGYSLDEIKKNLEKKNMEDIFPPWSLLSKEQYRRPGFEQNQTKGSKTCQFSIGVVVTCYNNESTIEHTLASLMGQTRLPDEVVVVDDASSDASFELLRKVKSNCTQFSLKLIRNADNLGVAMARRLGFQALNTDFVTTLDGDDLFAPEKLEAEFAALGNNPNNVAFSDTLTLTETGPARLDSSEYHNAPPDKLLQLLASRSAPVPRDLLIPKKLYERVGGFDPYFDLYEDWALKMRLASTSREGQWCYSAYVGSIYDRRSPGLSNKPKLVLGYGQLLAIARNISLFCAIPQALSSGLRTVAGCFEEGLRKRFEELTKLIESEGMSQELYRRFTSLWADRDVGRETKAIAHDLWLFSKPIERKSTEQTIVDYERRDDSATTRIFLVTPVLNGAEYIERCIKSVVNQEGDFELYYHIQDGGSTDGTIQVVESWKKRIESGELQGRCRLLTMTWRSETDTGMYDAVAKGFEALPIRDEDWMTWLNADDTLTAGSCGLLSFIDQMPDVSINWVTGKTCVKSLSNKVSEHHLPVNSEVLRRGLCDGHFWPFLQQEGTYFRGFMWKRISVKMDFSRLGLAGDWNLWRRFAETEEIVPVNKALGIFHERIGQLSRELKKEYLAEIDTLVDLTERMQAFDSFPLIDTVYSLIQVTDSGNLVREQKNIAGQYTYLRSCKS
ncbi:glycosyltransferase [Allochromatium palmeri]|uniref:Glycosyltransferase n=1 Tax=Allochromatium palmeri TaxID=231048 RepID=A0A6N8EAE8_9GAMM|nr:glycosyltransferase [Allochromatium palmeri]MTW21252.1 glycosyltransferase [Allochromatium palmeri]